MRTSAILTAASVLAVAAWHVFMTTLYLLPTNPISLRWHQEVQSYMYPLFGQSWHLFSPNPGLADDRIWIRYRMSNGAWSDWREPSLPIRQSHEYRVFLTSGRRLRIYDGLANRLRERVDESFATPGAGAAESPLFVVEAQQDRDAVAAVLGSREYSTTRRYAAAHVPGSQPVGDFQVRLVRTVPPTLSQLQSDSSYPPTTEIIEFPVSSVPDR